MENKKRVIMILMILMLISASIFIYLIYKNKQTTTTTPTTPPKTALEKEVEEKTPSEEDVLNIKMTKATIKKIDLAKLTVYLTEEDQELELNISQDEPVSFVKQTKQEDESMLNEEVALLDLPLDKEVEVQYNSKTKQLLMVILKNN
jgi:cell division protein FtsL